jgi:uncharacterized protein YggE
MLKGKLAALSALVVLSTLAAGLRAQEDSSRPPPEPAKSERINLTVDGHASAPADQVTLDLVVLAAAEVGADAESAHRSKLRSVLQGLDELKERLADEERTKKQDGEGPEPPPYTVEVHEGSSSVLVSGYMQGANRAKPVSSIQVATVLSVKIKNAAAASRLKLRKRLIRIIDAALDAGAEMGAPDWRLRPGIRFEPRDPEALREAAYQDALSRARERASRLARLAGRELGAVSGISEQAWSVRGNRSDYRGYVNYNQMPTNLWNQHQLRRADSQGLGALVSPIDEMTTTLSEIEIDTTLAVEFELGRVIK